MVSGCQADRVPIRRFVLALATGAVVGCAGDRSEEGSDDTSRVIDVVVSDRTPIYAVDPSSVVSIGVVSGDALYQFSRIAFAARLSDGRIVVADGSSREIRFFDPQGAFVQRVGGRGQGPGEFEAFTRVWVIAGDTLVVFDSGLGRVTTLAPDGSVGETRAVAGLLALGQGAALPGSDRTLFGVLDDGRFVIGYSEDPDSRISATSHGDTLALPYRVVVSDAEGTQVDSVAVVPGILRRANVTEVPTPAGPVRVADPQPFPSQLTGTVLVAGSGHLVVMSRTDRYEITVFDLDHGSTHVIRRADVPSDVLTSDRLTSFDAAFYDVITSPPDGARDVLLGSPIPTHSGVLLDDEGRMWVRGPEPILPNFSFQGRPPRSYTVIDPTGEVLGTAELPEGFEVLHVGSEHVSGRYRNELGVESVAVYRYGRD